MAKRLITCFDGTWNSPEDSTNVYRIFSSIAPASADGMQQLAFYDPGVGTHWYDRFTGAAFGRGLSQNIRQGYRWLADNYADGDEIFVFGFSRGAYTARSLVGFIRKCGLLRQPTEELVRQACDLYRAKDETADSPEAVDFRSRYSREIRIRFIGVWDTVGDLGIPVSHVPFSRDYYGFHDTKLSRIVEFAYHAVAIDEHRQDYAPTLWTEKPERTVMEQRWFIGAHANVGGGYKNDPLPTAPLAWMQEKAAACGLAFKGPMPAITPADYMAPIRNTYNQFLFGLYKLIKKPYYRPIGGTPGETVDETPKLRLKEDPSYRPENLLKYLGK